MRTFGYIGSGILVVGSLLIATSAIAGGFAIREQSTTGLGKAFADSAAGSDLSSMYWNPAAVTSQDGLNSLSSFTAIIGNATISPAAGPSTDISDDIGWIAGSYYNYQVNSQLYIGLSINAPFGLITEPDKRAWAGAAYNVKSEMLSLNAAPTIGYKITPELSVAAGVQVEYIKVRLSAATGPTTDGFFKGDDVAVGFTLGALYKNESSGTSLGVGFRSSIAHSLKGDQVSQPATIFSIDAQLDTPEMLTASIRQELTPRFAVMGNVEWANWSRMKELRVKNAAGATTAYDDFSWEDSWFASIGAEMQVSENLIARTGLGIETTPVPDHTRGARLPDSDRVWLSLGASYKWSDATTLDFGYSHIFLDDSKIALVPVAPDPRPGLNADVTNSADIISVGLRHKW